MEATDRYGSVLTLRLVHQDSTSIALGASVRSPAHSPTPQRGRPDVPITTTPITRSIPLDAVGYREPHLFPTEPSKGSSSSTGRPRAADTWVPASPVGRSQQGPLFLGSTGRQGYETKDGRSYQGDMERMGRRGGVRHNGLPGLKYYGRLVDGDEMEAVEVCILA